MSQIHTPPVKEQHRALVQLGDLLRQQRYRFITVTPQTHNIVNARPENGEARDLVDIFGWNRRFRLAALDDQLISIMKAADILVPDGAAHCRSTVRWSTLGNQLYLHSGYPTDQVGSVYFGPDTYRFVRSLDIHLASHAHPIQRVVEIGCGAGPAAIELAKMLPTAEVLALDINPAALAMAKVNAELAAVSNLAIRHSDLLHAVEGEFDLIIANPPYMADSEHRLYRDGGGQLGSGLSLEIVRTSLPRLAPGGSLLLYTGSAITAVGDILLDQLVRDLQQFPSMHWKYEEVDPDVYGDELLKADYKHAERIAVVQLTVVRRASPEQTPAAEATDKLTPGALQKLSSA